MAGAALSAVACVVLSLSLFGLSSVGQVDQNEYGLVMNWVTKKIGDQVYHGGTHLIGFWNTFVTFPATVQTIEFSERPWQHTAPALHTRTKDGLGLHLSISFQYKLQPDDIPKLYALTNIAYEGLFTRIARDQLLEAASEYEGPQYWRQRSEIGNRMKGLVNEQLSDSYASLWGLQLLIIDLPDGYENAITQTQVQKQTAATRENEQVAAGIRADTEVMTADYAKQIKIVQAGANANFTLKTRMAEAEATKRKITAEAEALAFTRDKLKLSAAGTVEYQQLVAYSQLENATFLANVLGTTPVIDAAAKPPSASVLQKAFTAAVESAKGSKNAEERQVAATAIPSPTRGGQTAVTAIPPTSQGGQTAATAVPSATRRMSSFLQTHPGSTLQAS
jgi:hypothetical protein